MMPTTRLFAPCATALLLLSGCASSRSGRRPGPALPPVDAVIAEYHVVVSSARPGSSRVGVRGDIVRSAMSLLGRPYRWGGADSAFDCSGLTMTVYGLSGISLPRSTAEQFSAGAPVGAERLQEGDLVFFAIETRDRPSHVGLYIGDGRFVHAPARGRIVRADDLSDRYYRRHWLAGRSYLR